MTLDFPTGPDLLMVKGFSCLAEPEVLMKQERS